MNDNPNLALEKNGIVFTNNASPKRIFKKASPYVCFICLLNYYVKKAVTKHVHTYQHIEHENMFKKYFTIIPRANLIEETSLMCKICNYKLVWGDLIEHALSHNVIPWLKPDDLHRNLFRNFISEHKNSIYQCNLCNITYGHWFHALEHVKDSKHIKAWNLTSAPSANYALYESNAQQFKMLVNNRIFIGDSKPFYCHMCNLGFDSITQSSKHWEGLEHKSIRLRFLNEISQFKSETPESFALVKNSAFLVVMKDKVYCKICDIYMIDTKEIDSHLKSYNTEHAQAILEDNKHQSPLEKVEADYHHHGPSVPLTECALVVPNHLKWMITAHKVVVKHQHLYCVLCKKILNNNSAVEGHLMKHLKSEWQETYLPFLLKGPPYVQATKKLTEICGSVCETGTSGQGASTSGNAKRTAVSPNGFEQNKMLKMGHSGLIPVFQNVKTPTQIVPLNSQPVNNSLPLLSTPGSSNISRFQLDLRNTTYPATIEENYPPLLPTSIKKKSKYPNKNTRPNLIDLMKNIPSLMTIPASKLPPFNNPGMTSIPNGKTPVNNQVHINPTNNPINQPSSSNPPNNPTYGKKIPSKPDPQSLPLNNPFLNPHMMVKLHKANYLFFAKNIIYEMIPEKRRRIILSSQLSFFLKYTPDYFLYCVVCEKSISYNLQSVYEHWCSSEHNEYLWKMEEDDKQFSNFPTQFSCLALSKEFMIENHRPGVSSHSELREFTCCACDAIIQDSDSLLRQHFDSEDHQNNVQRLRRHSAEICKDLFNLVESSWYSIDKYSCWPCQKILSNEVPYAEHLNSKAHLNTIRVMTPAEKERYSFDSCTACGILWFGDQDEYPKHCYKDAIHKELTRSIEDRVDHLPKEASNLCSSPETTIGELIHEADKVHQDRGRESELIRSLELAVRRKFPEAKAHPFGSRVTGLGFTNSDIDIFLDCGGGYSGQYCNTDDLISRIHQCLKLDSQAWNIESVIENSRTPIIKVYHSHSQLKCDVSFTNGLSVENTKLLKTYLDAYPPCREMILFIKKWLSLCGIAGSRSITNYAISWFVIFYLQERKIFPSVASLITNKQNTKIISGWQVGMKPFTVLKWATELRTKQLLREFFTYYAEFDYRFNVACPLLGVVKSKKEFLYLQLLPDEMKTYVDHVMTEPYPELFRIDSAMCIQDPYDLSHNLTKAVKKVIVNRFRKLCKKSAKILSTD